MNISTRQHTIGREVWCEGVGLHSGARIAVGLKPAPLGTGIQFCRRDLPGRSMIHAHYHHIVDTRLATTIGAGGATVATIEHLMAAFLGSGIDNVIVELNGPEVPIFDGSAARWLDLIQEAGSREQSALRRGISITRPIFVNEGEAFIKAVPSSTFRVKYVIDFPHPLVGKQEKSWIFDESSFGREIAPARTFGFLKDVERLKSMGLALGGSLANAVVFDDYGILNQEGFRYDDECVRHKILDFIGDLALAGMPLIGSFEVHKAGHALHSRFLKQLMAKPGCHAVSAVPCNPAFFPPSAIPGFMEPSMAKPF